MTVRAATTGAVLEAMIVPALTRAGYVLEQQVRVGNRCGGRVHKVDAIATRGDTRALVSLKWQQTGAPPNRRCRSR